MASMTQDISWTSTRRRDRAAKNAAAHGACVFLLPCLYLTDYRKPRYSESCQKAQESLNVRGLGRQA